MTVMAIPRAAVAAMCHHHTLRIFSESYENVRGPPTVSITGSQDGDADADGGGGGNVPSSYSENIHRIVREHSGAASHLNHRQTESPGPNERTPPPPFRCLLS